MRCGEEEATVLLILGLICKMSREEIALVTLGFLLTRHQRKDGPLLIIIIESARFNKAVKMPHRSM